MCLAPARRLAATGSGCELTAACALCVAFGVCVCTAELSAERQKHEDAIKSYTGDDPLAPWYALPVHALLMRMRTRCTEA